LKLKEIIKQKWFMPAAGITTIIALVLYLKRPKQTESETDTSYIEDDIMPTTSGSGYSNGSSNLYDQASDQEDYTQAQIEGVYSQIDNLQDQYTDDLIGVQDTIEQQTTKLDDITYIQANQDNSIQIKQDVSNKIRDLQDKYAYYKEKYLADEKPLTSFEKNTLDSIHQEAEKLGINAGLGSGGTTGSNRQMLEDTRLDDTNRQSQVEATKKIVELQRKYEDIKSKSKEQGILNSYQVQNTLKSLHEHAEKIGIEAGLGSGGTTGAARKMVF
jgi:hypothetical protein